MNIDISIPNLSLIPSVEYLQARQQQSRISPVEVEGPNAFDHFLQAAMDVVNDTNVRIIESDVAQVDFATGRTNDMLTVILAYHW